MGQFIGKNGGKTVIFAGFCGKLADFRREIDGKTGGWRLGIDRRTGIGSGCGFWPGIGGLLGGLKLLLSVHSGKTIYGL